MLRSETKTTKQRGVKIMILMYEAVMQQLNDFYQMMLSQQIE
ncbi:hypothetical protein [Bacillus thuringiensis]|nr:hypothetical protein [Bacillus thuringiensis]